MKNLIQHAQELLVDAGFGFTCLISEEAEPDSGRPTLFVRALDVPADEAVEYSKALTQTLFKLFLEGTPCVSMTISPEGSSRFRDLAIDGHGVLWRPTTISPNNTLREIFDQHQIWLRQAWRSTALEDLAHSIQAQNKQLDSITQIVGSARRWTAEWRAAASYISEFSAKFSEPIESLRRWSDTIQPTPKIDMSFSNAQAPDPLSALASDIPRTISGRISSTPQTAGSDSPPPNRLHGSGIEFSSRDPESEPIVSYSAAA
jgi:hypothetical protein